MPSASVFRLLPGLVAGLFLFLFIATPAVAEPSGERDSVKLLTVGNSFANNAITHLLAIAEAGGKELTVFGANIGGCSFERHARHLRQALAGEDEGRAYKNIVDPTGDPRRDFTLPEALALMPWDAVTIQQVSHQSFRPESFEPHAGEVVAAIREHAPTAEILVHQTWAYRPDHRLYAEESIDTEQMYAGLRANYVALAERHGGLRLLPSGDAFHLAYNSPLWRYQRDPAYDYANPPAGRNPVEISLYVGTRWNREGTGLGTDAFHANTAGCYLAGAVWYLTLYQADEVPAGFTPPGLTEEQANDLRVHALAAVRAERARPR